MATSDQPQDKTIAMIRRLLSGPSRPGQAFTIPGCNYDALYRTARRINAFFDGTGQDGPPVCLCCEDRAVIAAALLASLASGTQLLLPQSLSKASLLELHRLTGFTQAIGKKTDFLPADVTLVEMDTLTEEVESWICEAETDPERPWIHLSTDGTSAAQRLRFQTPRNLLGEVDDLINRYAIGSNDRFLATVPALHGYGLLYSLLVPLAASARVAAATPAVPEEIRQLAADISPTIFVGMPAHYRALKAHPLGKGALRLAFSAGSLEEADGPAFSEATGVHVVDLEKRGVDPCVKFEPTGLKVPLDPEKSIQALGGDHGIDIRADCGGMGVCGKCRILTDPKENFTPLTIAERDGLTPEQIADGSRLACQTHAVATATVSIPDTLAESTEARGKTRIDGSYPVDPMVRRLTAEGRSPGLKTDNLPESLVDWLATQVGQPVAPPTDAASLRRLAAYRGSLNAFTLVVHEKTGIRRILDGRQTFSLGLAVDLGTTSVAGYLCNLKTGKLLAADACVNPQRRFGEDVISRISHANQKKSHMEGLQRLAAEAINFIMTRCLERIGAASEDIDEVAVCGNTTMQQILAGFHPYGLGVFPYFPLTLTPPVFNAGELGLATDPAVPVVLMPVISGFVGGDTLSAILADRPHERDEVTLIVDIGTNGEVVLGSRKGLWVTSCATGPALEGAQISCGMRASTGAIHRMQTDSSHRIAYDVLGAEGSRPMGICGSGIIDAIAVLRRIGAILPNGRLNEKDAGVVSDEKGIGRHYTIADGDQSATGGDIAITLKDVRQIQLAKGALSTGIQFLMRKAGIAQIDRTVLTGAFGARFNWKNALAIGMLPPQVALGEVVSKENLAGVGVVMALLDKRLRSEARDLCRRIRYLELASESDFAVAFAEATSFPEIEVQ
ncbi:MAG: ASKHA domain-containing protein [Desulfosarcina sp.]